MKKYLIIFLVFTMVILSAFSVSAANRSESIEVYRNLVKLDVNNNRINVDNFLYNGVTYVPIRAIGEMLDKVVGWNSYTGIASIDDNKYEIQQLSLLLPETSGFVWNYEGFAEYSHQMHLDNINDGSQQRVYNITGEVGDPSGGENQLDTNLSIKYTILGNKLVQEKIESKMLDSKYNKLTLIQAPLVVGTLWKEDVVDKKGISTNLSAFIQKVEITNDGRKQYTVRYDDNNSSYYEVRVIKEGVGVVNFEKLLELQDDSFPVTYFMHETSDVTKIQVKLYFPNNNAEKLQLEQRDLNVINSGVARAAVEALIAGPTNKLVASIPSGTRLLNIYILEDIAYIDFSKEFISNHSGGSAGEIMTLYSIVNTLTEFDTINGVQILIEGKKGETLGNIILDEPIVRRQDLIVN